jgi:hypothetical protein
LFGKLIQVFKPALTPALSPKERESELAVRENSIVAVVIPALFFFKSKDG